MINESYKKMLQGKSIIRELSEYATERGKEIGYENVFDFSLGNPSVPCTQDYTDTVIKMYEEENPMAIHGYSPSLGIESVRTAVAESLNRRFGMDYETKHIFMTSGAAGALAHAFRLVTKPGDEIIVFAPFFPEYHEYIGRTGAVMKIVPANTETFQINFEAFEETLNEKTAAVLINTPNNPSGIPTIQRLFRSWHLFWKRSRRNMATIFSLFLMNLIVKLFLRARTVLIPASSMIIHCLAIHSQRVYLFREKELVM